MAVLDPMCVAMEVQSVPNDFKNAGKSFASETLQ
jgi:hypothetical protein